MVVLPYFVKRYFLDNRVFCAQAFYIFMKIVNPTMEFSGWKCSLIPINPARIEDEIYTKLLQIDKNGKNDWDSYERSWDFKELPLLTRANFNRDTLASTYTALRERWREIPWKCSAWKKKTTASSSKPMAWKSELDPDVPLEEITLTCNPHYRYRARKPKKNSEALLLEDTMKELISYSVGCMFGRYSLEVPGLILANQGDTLATTWLKFRAHLPAR